MPAGLGCIASHIGRDQTKPRGFPCLGRQLQPPPFGQVQRLVQFHNHQGAGPVAQRFFGGGKAFGLIFDLCHKQAGGIEKAA